MHLRADVLSEDQEDGNGSQKIQICVKTLGHLSGSVSQLGGYGKRRRQIAVSRKPHHTIPFLSSSSEYFVPRQTIPSFHSV